MSSSSTVGLPQRSNVTPTASPRGWLGEAAFRTRDVAVALSALVVLAPVWIVLGIAARIGWLQWKAIPRLGKSRTEFVQWQGEFTGTWRGLRAFGSLPVLWNVLRGEMSLVGPRAVSPEEPIASEAAAQPRFDCRPGLIGLRWIRTRARMAYEPEWVDDLEYVRTRSFRGDLLLLVRAAVACVLGESAGEVDPQLSILGIRIDNLSMAEAIDRIMAMLSDSLPRRVCFVNADYANIAARDPEYRWLLATADLVLADGIGMRLAGKWLRQAIRENVNGTDLFPRLCAALSGSGHTIYLLGGQPGVAEAVRHWIELHYPATIVAGCRHGYFTTEEEPAIVEAIRTSGASLLLVATGVPNQERFLADHLHETGCRVGMGVGGLFDFYSGRRRRAPKWLRELGLEWFYRFIQEPRRLWKRYFLGNGLFLGRVVLHSMRKPTPQREAETVQR